jgi:hypothetical protein
VRDRDAAVKVLLRVAIDVREFSLSGEFVMLNVCERIERLAEPALRLQD